MEFAGSLFCNTSSRDGGREPLGKSTLHIRAAGRNRLGRNTLLYVINNVWHNVSMDRANKKREIARALDTLTQLAVNSGNSLVNVLQQHLAHPADQASPKPHLRDQADHLSEIRLAFEETMFEILCDALSRYGLNVGRAEEAFRSDSYWKSAPVFLVAFAFWLKTKGLVNHIDVPETLIVVLTGTVGYRVMDLYFDHERATKAEAIMGLALVREYETAILKQFGVTAANLESLASADREYFEGEILEKQGTLEECPYTFESIHLLARKASMVFFLFEAGLRACGEETRINAYRDAFNRIAAAVQILDDLSDLEEDISSGFRTLPTVGFDQEVTTLPPEEAARVIRGSQQAMTRLYTACCNLLVEAGEILRREQEVVLGVMCQYYLLKVHRVFQGREVFSSVLGLRS